MIPGKNILKGGALVGALLVCASSVSAYDQRNTHPALTSEIVNFYNLNFPDKKISEQEKQWLIRGSVEEDTGERPMFHFYDPVYNRGIGGAISSKKWALNSGIQADYYNSRFAGLIALTKKDSDADFSYERALRDYTKGERERAFVAFGHTLHLLEDAGVPDHTRNDAHPGFIHGQESPYESEMAKWNPGNFQIARTLFLKREKPSSLNSLSDYFDELANYSNQNFFSKDTISNTRYPSPNTGQLARIMVRGEPKLFIVNKDAKNRIFPIAFVNAGGEKDLGTALISDEIGTLILDGYWERLSPEIVKNGAGALRLFLEEAEKAKEEYANRPPAKPSLWAQLLSVFGIGDTTHNIAGADLGRVDNNDNPDLLVTRGDNDGVTNTLPIVSPTLSPSPRVSPILSPSPTPKISPSPSVSPILASVKAEKVNINTANKELLMTLKGIKEAKSEAIIQHRQTHGLFQRVEDVMNVNGIGQATFNDIKDSITVGDIIPTPYPVPASGGGGSSSSTPTPIPTPLPSPTPSPTPSPDPEVFEKMNINTASREELDTLPGIGEVKSQAIVDYREANGPFQTIEDIINVSGIGEVTFENIKDLITVGDIVVSESSEEGLGGAPASDSLDDFSGVSALWSFEAEGAVGQSAISSSGNVVFGVFNAENYKVYSINSMGTENWNYSSTMPPGNPAVLSDGSVYFGRIGGGFLPVTALNSDGTLKWEYSDSGSVEDIVVSADGSAYFSTDLNPNSRIQVLGPDGVLKNELIGAGFAGFSPVVLADDTIIAAQYSSGNQFFTAYASDSTQLWQNAWTMSNGYRQSNISYDPDTGKAYSAAHVWLFELNPAKEKPNAKKVDPAGIAATTVVITPTSLILGMEYPDSSSKLFSFNKTDLSTEWSFAVEGGINPQIAVDKDQNIYFSTEGGVLYSLDPEGNENWQLSAGEPSLVSPVWTENGVVWGFGNTIIKVGLE